MAKTNKIINEGGTNGTGTARVDTDSEDFKALQEAIRVHYEGQGEEAIGANELLQARFRNNAL